MEVINVERLLCEKDIWFGRTVSVTGRLMMREGDFYIAIPGHDRIDPGVLLEHPDFLAYARGSVDSNAPIFDTPCQITGLVGNTPLTAQGLLLRDLKRGAILFDIPGRGPFIRKVDFDDERGPARHDDCHARICSC